MLSSNNISNSFVDNFFVVQWNCNGFLNKKNNIKLICQNFKPLVLALQETHLKPSCDITGFKQFNFFRKDYVDGLSACKGVMLMIHKCVHSEPVAVFTSHNVVAAKLRIPNLRQNLTICSIYVSPGNTLTESNLHDICLQLPKPFLLCGDFNAHSPAWGPGNTSLDHNGRETEKFLDSHPEFLLLNTGEITHINFSYRTQSAIDLSIVSQSIAPYVSWSVHDDLCFSDHLPVLLTFSHGVSNTQSDLRKVWIFKRADWMKYQENVNFDFDTSKIMDVNKTVELVNKNILDAAESSIPLYNTKNKKKYVPWWTEELKHAIQDKKHALKLFRRNSTPQNFIEFKKLRSRARKLMHEAQEKSWYSFVDSIDKPVNQSSMWAQLRRVKGKKPYNPITALRNLENQIVTDRRLMTEILVENYVKNSGDSVYCDEFRLYKATYESSLPCPLHTQNEHYNNSFSMEELTATFLNCRSSAAGKMVSAIKWS